MNLFTNIFKKTPNKRVERVELSGYSPVFTAWSGDAYSNDLYRERQFGE